MSDLINRKDAIDILYKCTPFDSDGIKLMERLEERINALPSVDRPQGEWIGEADGYADGEFVYDTWYCSNCDYAVDDDKPPTWNYCPNCGCRMKGVDDEEPM